MLSLKRGPSALLHWTLCTCLALSPAVASPADPYAAVDASWQRFGAVYGRILQDYYATVLPDSIMQGAIEGMLGRLDVYSHYYQADGLRQLREDTTGRFAGLGVTVAVISGEPVVVAPMDGTPAQRAGLVSGDFITAIEGRPTRQMTLDDVVDMLRGDPGSVIQLTVRHPAPTPATYDLAITREIIQIPSVTVVQMVAPRVGYIGMRQSRFAEDTAHEVAAAISQLIDAGARSFVLDLRGNPGGLLTQATQVADLFLPRGAPIVSVRERDGRREELRRSDRRPEARDCPLAVLIDGGSASAAEIVAGAIQDNDRGVLLGTTSFGKGSVQTIFDLHNRTSAALKLTTARYYTPSGRCIHRSPRSRHHLTRRRLSAGDAEVPLAALLQIVAGSANSAAARDALTARFGMDAEAAYRLLETSLHELADAAGTDTPADTTAGAPGEAYHTRAGRPVYGGGGIAPDIVVRASPAPTYVRQLQRLGLFFEFAVTRLAADSTTVAGLREQALDEYLLSSFTAYAAEKDDLPVFDAGIRAQLDHLRGELESVGLRDRTAPELAALEAAIAALREEGYPPVLRAAILRQLRAQLTLRFHGQRALDLLRLREDAQLAAAISLLQDETAYAEALRGAG